MNSKSKWETTSSEYGLLEGEYVNLIATMCVTDSNSKPFSFKPIPLPEEAQEDITNDEEVIMADKGKILRFLHIQTLRPCKIDSENWTYIRFHFQRVSFRSLIVELTTILDKTQVWPRKSILYVQISQTLPTKYF